MDARKYLAENVHCDRLTARKDGTFELRHSYFSVAGYDPAIFAEQVVQQAGGGFNLVHSYCGLKHFVVVLEKVTEE